MERARNNRIPKVCVICGKESRIKPSHQATEGTYCSRECMAKGYSRINTATSSYSRTKSGKRDDLGMFFRSRWEANYARYLNWLVAQKQIIEWRYESETFEFPVKRGSKFYTPDFLITNNDGSKEYHEVKGWMDQKSRTKLKRFARYYPDKKLVLIEERYYKDIQNKVGRMIEHWEWGTRK